MRPLHLQRGSFGSRVWMGMLPSSVSHIAYCLFLNERREQALGGESGFAHGHWVALSKGRPLGVQFPHLNGLAWNKMARFSLCQTA